MAILRLPRQLMDALEHVCSSPIPALEGIERRLSARTDITLSVAELRSAAEEDFDQKSARGFVRLLLSLASLWRERSDELSDVLTDVTETLEENWSEEPDRLARWRERSDLLAKILRTDVVQATSKAMELGYSYASILDSVRILTDLRPVFDRGHDNIIGSVVAQTLRIFYRDGSGTKEIDLLLDDVDINELSSACEIALKKSNAAKRLMKEKCDLETLSISEIVDDTRTR